MKNPCPLSNPSVTGWDLVEQERCTWGSELNQLTEQDRVDWEQIARNSPEANARERAFLRHQVRHQRLENPS